MSVLHKFSIDSTQFQSKYQHVVGVLGFFCFFAEIELCTKNIYKGVSMTGKSAPPMLF